eukprot:COSAG06_NODE_14529_length_1149_cov_1.612381_1_plen_118_part_10
MYGKAMYFASDLLKEDKRRYLACIDYVLYLAAAAGCLYCILTKKSLRLDRCRSVYSLQRDSFAMPLAATPPPLRFRLQFEPELVHPEVRRCMYTAPAEGDTVADLLAAIAADPTFELS